MKETIERLRAAREQILRGAGSDDLTLLTIAEDIQTSIDELERVQAMTEALAPAFMSVDNAVRKAYKAQVEAQAQAGEQFGEAVKEALAPYVRKVRCTCGTVDVTSGLTGYQKTIPGLTDPQCPFHGKPEVESTDV